MQIMGRAGEGAVVAGQATVAGADGGSGRAQGGPRHGAAEGRRAEARPAGVVGLRGGRAGAAEVPPQRVVVRRGGPRCGRRCR